jgi:peptidoglycan/xylan/chitin deacetylase (PgdA/CDA1 family)
LATLGGLVFLTVGCDEPRSGPPVLAPSSTPSGGDPRAARTTTSATTAPARKHPAGASTNHHPSSRSTSDQLSHAPGRRADGDQSVKRWVPSSGRQIALTIDDGPAPDWTQRILDLLERYAVTATFCVVGRNVVASPQLARMAAERGHLLANHTWDHADLARASTTRIRDEIDRTQAAVHEATGQTPTFFRAPYGAWSRSITDSCAQRGLRPLGWSVDPQDWARPSVPVLVSRLLHDITPGSIVLEHDGGGDRSQTLAALSVVLPRLIGEGYHFVTP